MIISGIISSSQGMQTASLITSILTAGGRKVSVMDGTVLEQLDPNQVKRYLAELDRNRTDIFLLRMIPQAMVNRAAKNLQFDVMLYADKADDSREGNRDAWFTAAEAFSLLGENGIAIINVDDVSLLRQLNGMKHRTVTYGFNMKASVTPSSTGDGVLKDNFMCCVQRSIPTVTGVLVEPREFVVVPGMDELDDDHILAAATFAVVNGMDMDRVECSGNVEGFPLNCQKNVDVGIFKSNNI